MRIGIFGGSFNPVHAGHLKLALGAMSELNLERVVFVPSHQNPLKSGAELESAGIRVARLEKAIKKFPYFSLSLCEIRRKGLSYTVDTLRTFKKKFGRKAVLYFLVGADSLKNFSRWKSTEQILRLCRLAVFSRPGFSLPIGQAGARHLPAGALYVPMDALDVSSTQIRGSLSSR